MKKKDDFKMLLMNLFDLIYTEIDNDNAKEYGLELVKKLEKKFDDLYKEYSCDENNTREE